MDSFWLPPSTTKGCSMLHFYVILGMGTNQPTNQSTNQPTNHNNNDTTLVESPIFSISSKNPRLYNGRSRHATHGATVAQEPHSVLNGRFWEVWKWGDRSDFQPILDALEKKIYIYIYILDLYIYIYIYTYIYTYTYVVCPAAHFLSPHGWQEIRI